MSVYFTQVLVHLAVRANPWNSLTLFSY